VSIFFRIVKPGHALMNDPKGRIFRPPASVAPRPPGSALELWLCLGRNLSGEYDAPDYIHVLEPICSASQYKTFRTAVTNLLDTAAKDEQWYNVMDFITLSIYPRRCERKLANDLQALLNEHSIPMRVAVHQDHTWGRSIAKIGADLKATDQLGQVLAQDWFGEGAPFWPPNGFSLVASLPAAVQWPPSSRPTPAPAAPPPAVPTRSPAPSYNPPPQPYLSPPRNTAPSHSSGSIGRSSAYYGPPLKTPQWAPPINPPMSPGYGAPQYQTPVYYSPPASGPANQNGGYGGGGYGGGYGGGHSGGYGGAVNNNPISFY